MPLHRRLPKRGFKNIFRIAFSEVNLGLVQKAIDGGRLDAAQPVDAVALEAAGLTGKLAEGGVRLLARGELKAKVHFVVAGASKPAIEAVEKLGGKVEIIAAAEPKSE